MTSRIGRNYDEAKRLVDKFQFDKHMLALAMVQLIEREKVRVLNDYRQQHGEPPIPPEPPKLPGARSFEWVIDVPKSWTSLTGDL